MSLPFEIAGGSITGQAHVAARRNNQDAFAWEMNGGGLVAVVCDGCGTAPHSEAGSQLGARLVTGTCARLLSSGLDPETLL
jgi:serine/threonine protein phosphatase PrpC